MYFVEVVRRLGSYSRGKMRRRGCHILAAFVVEMPPSVWPTAQSSIPLTHWPVSVRMSGTARSGRIPATPQNGPIQIVDEMRVMGLLGEPLLGFSIQIHEDKSIA